MTIGGKSFRATIVSMDEDVVMAARVVDGEEAMPVRVNKIASGLELRPGDEALCSFVHRLDADGLEVIALCKLPPAVAKCPPVARRMETITLMNGDEMVYSPIPPSFSATIVSEPADGEALADHGWAQRFATPTQVVIIEGLALRPGDKVMCVRVDGGDSVDGCEIVAITKI